MSLQLDVFLIKKGMGNEKYIFTSK